MCAFTQALKKVISGLALKGWIFKHLSLGAFTDVIVFEVKTENRHCYLQKRVRQGVIGAHLDNLVHKFWIMAVKGSF